VEQGLHAGAEAFVVAVDAGVCLGWPSWFGSADAGEDRGDDLVAEGEQRGDGAGGSAGHLVAVAPAGFDDEVFGAQFAQVVGGLPDAVVLLGLAGERSDLGGEVGDGEPVGGDGQCEDGGQRGPGEGLVEVDAADAGRAGLGRGRQLVEDAVGQERDVDAVEHAGEPVDHGGQAGHDGGELLDHPAGVQGLGVVHDRLEAQYVFAFGVGLQRQQPEVDLEQGEVPPRSLDHDCLIVFDGRHEPGQLGADERRAGAERRPE